MTGAGAGERSRPQISAFVITRNEAAKVDECLASLAWVEEIVVVDDFSTDATPDLCRGRGVRFVQHQFTGFRDQKAYAMSLTSHPWVLELDADERISPELRRAIEELPAADWERYAGFAFRRLTSFWGRWIRHASLYPDHKLRLYHRERGAWSTANIHERFVPAGPTRKIAADIIHDQDLDLRTYLERTARYADLSARELHARGKRAAWHHLTVRPLYTFLYRYLIRLGFLEGVAGLVISFMGGVGTFMKYGRLRELQERNQPVPSAGPPARSAQ